MTTWRAIESSACFALGTASIALIQLAELKDITTIGVGLVTCVCMIYTAFIKKAKTK